MIQKTTMAILLMPALILVSGSSLPAAPPPENPAGYWSFNSTDIDHDQVLDSSGNGHTAQIERGVLVTGRIGQALELAGSGHGVTIEGLGLMGQQQSICLWIKQPANDNYQRLIYINGLYQVGFGGKNLFVHTGRPSRGDPNMPLADLDIALDQWTFLAITWDTAAVNEHVKVYVNGQLRATGTLDIVKNQTLKINTLRIGHTGDIDSADQSFVGTVDEVAVYTRTLPAEQIAAYYDRVKESVGEPVASLTHRVIVSRQRAIPPEPYYPQNPYTGRKKLLRVASELVSRFLDSQSIAEADLPSLVAKWQQTGIDGMVFNISSNRRNETNRYWNMCGQWWALIPRTYEELEPDIRAFQSVKDWGRVTDNFLWSSYAVWGNKLEAQNWFNDSHLDIILANVRLQARVARECGFKGILLDLEQYTGHGAEGTWHIPFNYPNYREDGYIKEGRDTPRSFSEVAAKIRQRGTQYAQTVCTGFPGLKILIIPGLYEWTDRGDNEPLEDRHYGLYPAFINGMLEGLDSEATLISGNELTYSKTRYVDIGQERRRFEEAIENLCDAPDHLKQRMSFAAGIWVDTGRTWSDTDVNKNERSPQDHERAVRNAFIASDEYAWIYGEQSRFLLGTPTPLMQKYFQANIDAHDLTKRP